MSDHVPLKTLCCFTKGQFATLKTEPGDYPLVVTAAYRRTASTFQMEGPAVCVPLVSSTGHGDAALHRVHYQEGKFALANLLVALTAKDPSKLSIRYLYYLLMARKNELLVPLMQGTANVSLKVEDIANVSVSLPPIDRQQRTVAWIERLVAKIELAKGLRDEVADAMRAFIPSLHISLANGRQTQLADILALDEDRVQVIPDQSYPQVGVRGFGGGLFVRETLDSSQTTYKAFNRLYEGAIVLSQVKGWEGAIATCPASLAGKFVSPEYRTFRCSQNQVLPAYIGALVSTPWFWRQLKNITRGVGARRERTRPEQFLQMSIPMPTFEAQGNGAAIFERLNAAEGYSAAVTAELDAVLPSVLNRAFSREV